MGWDRTNCYGMGMGQINMSHGQPWLYLNDDKMYLNDDMMLKIKSHS